MFKQGLLKNNIVCSIKNSLSDWIFYPDTVLLSKVRHTTNLSVLQPIRNLRLCVGRNAAGLDIVGQNSVGDSSRLVDVIYHDSRIIKVAIVGVPNAGKSTIINQLVGQQVCSASSKVHTTRARVRAVVNEGNTQIVLLDTPGLVGSKQVAMHQLEKSFVLDGDAAAHEADTLCVIHDASNKWTREKIDAEVLRLLETFKEKRSFLVLNKVDLLKSKRRLLDLVHTLRGDTKSDNSNGWPHFEQIFMTSALTGSGIPELKDYLLDISNPGPWLFTPDVCIDQTIESLIELAVKAALLENLPEEIPYQIKPVLEHLHKSRDGKITTVVLLECSLKRIERMVMGAKGWRIRKIAQTAEQQLQSAFNTTVILNLVVTEAK